MVGLHQEDEVRHRGPGPGGDRPPAEAEPGPEALPLRVQLLRVLASEPEEPAQEGGLMHLRRSWAWWSQVWCRRRTAELAITNEPSWVTCPDCLRAWAA